MSDALTTDAVLDGTSQGQSHSANGEAQAETPKQESKRVNLHELPEFRELQSKRDKREAELQQQIAREREERVRLQKQFEEWQDRAAPDDFTRLENQYKRATAQLQAYEAELRRVHEEREAATAKDRALQELATELEVPVSAIADATDWKSAAKLAVKYKADQIKKQEHDDEDKRERNRPDVGGGKASVPASRLERDYEEARARKDSQAMVRIARELDKLGK